MPASTRIACLAFLPRFEADIIVLPRRCHCGRKASVMLFGKACMMTLKSAKYSVNHFAVGSQLGALEC